MINLPFHKTFFVFLLITFNLFSAAAQCPPNIDFEQGDFTGWQCWTGSVFSIAGKNVINWDAFSPGPPIANRHTMLSSAVGNGNDPFGGFPQNCPNGSGQSIKLGNTNGGHEAEGVSYTFTIPPGQNQFNLIYNYAVVFQGPVHQDSEQPRLIIEITNETDNTTLGCSSFNFFYSTSSPTIPGFYLSTTNFTGAPVWCKNWAANSINLDGNAGKKIKLFFKTADCVFTAHFGYAYIDVNTQCGSSFVGATFCPDDSLVNVTAPAGYQSYRWYDINNNALGTSQTLTLNPPPLSGDSVFVELTPFNGYGCLSTLTAHLWDTLTVQANAGPDKETCDNNPVQLGGPPQPGLVYKWTPAAGLNNAFISNPIATPSLSTQYTLTVTNSGGGCATPDIVNVNVDVLSDSIQLIGAASFCAGSGQPASLKVLPHDSVQWFRNNVALPGATQTFLNITQTGAYHAMLFSSAGCSRTTAVKQIDIWEKPVAGFVSNASAQCFTGHQFVFTNSSTISTGVLALQYSWSFGDGNTATARDVTHTYATTGVYAVKLLVTASGGCTDSAFFNVTVNPGPVANFTANTAVQCFKNNKFVFTNNSTITSGAIQYIWDMGDGTILTTKDVTHSYALPGNYSVKLTATASTGGCVDDSSITITVNPSPNAVFSINNNVQCFPMHVFNLSNSSTITTGGIQYRWDFGDGKSDTATFLNYTYNTAGNYTIKLITTAAIGGCKDSMNRNVMVHPTPVADFTIRQVCENLLVPVINRTINNTSSSINYLWDFGNGYTDNVKTPSYSYPFAGTYPVKLVVSTQQCPVSFDTKTINVTIDAAAPGIRYPLKDAAFNFPEPLQARPLGNTVTWTPATNLNNRFSYTPTFTGITPQLYTIQIKTATGCITIDTQFVTTHKKIEIYVPTGFTPNGNGINERLRPVLIGFNKVNYFRIYNRWGQLLFSMNNDQPGWDGKINSKPAEMQTIIWMIEAVDVDGKVHNRQGTTVVIR